MRLLAISLLVVFTVLGGPSRADEPLPRDPSMRQEQYTDRVSRDWAVGAVVLFSLTMLGLRMIESKHSARFRRGARY